MPRPPTFQRSERSEGSASSAAAMVINGVVALMMLATLDGTCRCAHANSKNGTTQSSIATTKRCAQMLHPRGSR